MFSIFDEGIYSVQITFQKLLITKINMSRNNEANRKKNKDKITQKKRRLQNAEVERKARLKQIREDFKAKEADNQ